MGLVVLKNQGYQEYQDALQKGVEPKPEARKAGREEDGKQPAARREKQSRAQRYLLLLTVFGVIAALSTATTIVLYRYGSAVSERVSGPAAPSTYEIADVETSAKLWAEQKSLWRCKDGRYTNTPTDDGVCEYVGAASGEDSSNRFITPSAPRF